MKRPLVALDASAQPPGRTQVLSDRHLLLAVVALAAAGIAGAVAVDIAGRGAFPTHPISAVALGAAAVAVCAGASTAHGRSAGVLRALSASLLMYLWLGVGACASDTSPWPVLWSVGWMPVNGLIVIAGLAAAAMRRSALAFGVLIAIWTTVAAVLVRPSKPFNGLPTAAPETWASRVPWLEAALMAALAAAMLLALICVLVRAFRAHVTERRHLANCVATTSMGAGLMVMCVALAALRDPGEIDPSTGSVGYIVAIAMVAVLATYGNAASPWPLRVVIGYWMAAFALLIGVYAAAVGPAAAGVAITVAITAAAAAATVWVVRWLERRLVVEKPRSVTSIPGLSPREQEVLAGVAAGATNAGIAADLFLSERTVEQHVRSIFAKLDLGDRDSSNHRVRAAVLWWQQQSFSGDVGEQ